MQTKIRNLKKLKQIKRRKLSWQSLYVLYAVTFTKEIAHPRDALSARFPLKSSISRKTIRWFGQLSTL
jgi:hypothetical protein